MSEFPKMLYQVGDQEEMHGGRYDYTIVNDQFACNAFLLDGWYLTPADATAAIPPKPVAHFTFPTREAMEAKATELGIKFDGRTRDAKLLSLIEEATQ